MRPQRRVWHYGEEVHDLGGTARTLDGADGAVELEHGLLSNWGGYSLLDDRPLAADPARRLGGAPAGGADERLYFFGYGHAYQECLRDFYLPDRPGPAAAPVRSGQLVEPLPPLR